MALALTSIMFAQVLVERLSGLPEAASRYSWIFTSLLSSDMLVQVFFHFYFFFLVQIFSLFLFLDFHLTILFRYAGSGIFLSDFPGQLCRAAIVILAKFCNCLLFFVYIIVPVFFCQLFCLFAICQLYFTKR